MAVKAAGTADPRKTMDWNKTGTVRTDVTLRHVRATIVAATKQRVLHILSVSM
jgi:hypothetical protein